MSCVIGKRCCDRVLQGCPQRRPRMCYRWTGDVIFSLQIEIMSFWKYSPFLALGFLVLYQAGVLQAAPFRSILDSHLGSASLNEKELCIILAAMVRDYAQQKINELEQETGRFSIATQKRECKTSTCVTKNLADKLGKRGGVLKDDFMPTGARTTYYGRRRKDLEK
ncbi:calcitonin receptor-stimulating peptide 2-like [Pteropus alecto]|uniref:calcitonin receptor-stimulating peptide 2-like n=1 Tax=Pteropus alecto TaxID=9402 RepID=UPI0007689877|nr:calcitonin receptor-stimulating peptide 2-like [Pteropus alecto]